MERIRDAISRARVAGESAARKEGRPAPAASGSFAPQIAPNDDAFLPVECNFDNFRKYRIISNEQDPVLNAYRVLRTRILQKMEAEGWKTIAVVSPGPGAGKTVTAINLAIAIGTKEGSRATLVDLDFYRPSVARYLGVRDFPSVLDYFEERASIQDVTTRPNLPDVLLLANERITRRGAEYLSSAAADRLIETTVRDYGSRVVIFDMSPLLGCDDSIAFLPKVDCVLFVAASGQTRVAEFKDAKRLLGGVNMMGTVLNKAPAMLMPNQYY